MLLRLLLLISVVFVWCECLLTLLQCTHFFSKGAIDSQSPVWPHNERTGALLLNNPLVPAFASWKGSMADYAPLLASLPSEVSAYVGVCVRVCM